MSACLKASLCKCFQNTVLPEVTRYNFSQKTLSRLRGWGRLLFSEAKGWTLLNHPYFLLPLNLNLMSGAIAAIPMGQQNEKLEETWILGITNLLHQPWIVYFSQDKKQSCRKQYDIALESTAWNRPGLASWIAAWHWETYLTSLSVSFSNS